MITNSSAVELIENREVAAERLRNIKNGLSYLADKYLPARAYTALLDVSVNGLMRQKNHLFYFPIPWDRNTGFPSHPSLVADAKHFCSLGNFGEAVNLIIGSFAGWQTFWKQKKFCSCGGKNRYVDLEIVVHHPVKLDTDSRTIEIKGLAGIKSSDRPHIEKHYKLRRESRVDKNISIVRTEFIKLDIPSFVVLERSEECSEQFDSDIFTREFAKVCKTAKEGLM